jgi:hypothetical protein
LTAASGTLQACLQVVERAGERDSLLNQLSGIPRATDLVEKLFDGQPKCQPSTRALRQEFDCISAEQSVISKQFEEMRTRTPQSDVTRAELCKVNTRNVSEDIRLSTELQTRVGNLITKLESVSSCKGEYDSWITTRQASCPPTVPVCPRLIEAWLEGVSMHLKPLSDVTDKVKKAQQQLDEIADNATILAFIQRLDCGR